MGKSDDNPIKVSILLPTFNRASLLPICVQSVLNQTYQNWELIIADDGSSDNTLEVSKKLQLLDSRINYHKNQKNVGLPKNRNISLSLASGKLVWFIEDDMIFKNDSLEILVRSWEFFNQKNERIGAICPALVSEENNYDTRRGILDFARKLKENELSQNPCVVDKYTGMIYRNFSPMFKDIVEIDDCHACSLYQREIFNQIKYDSEAYIGNFIGEESDFHFRLLKMGYKIYFQPLAIIYHNTINTGGCRLSLTRWSYFFIRNHVIFLKRNYGIRSIYKIPCFFCYNLYVIIRYLVQRRTSKEQNIKSQFK
jgi:glycosyltransferase involved in cell wall biosynthesis